MYLITWITVEHFTPATVVSVSNYDISLNVLCFQCSDTAAWVSSMAYCRQNIPLWKSRIVLPWRPSQDLTQPVVTTEKLLVKQMLRVVVYKSSQRYQAYYVTRH